MPATKKITRENIINGALDVLREKGYAAVNARSVAEKIGCSTQPIYNSFKNMDELKKELSRRAEYEHTERVRASLNRNDGTHSRYSDYGVGFVRFAEQEKQLFRWIYLEDGQTGKRRDDILLPDIIRTICEEYGYGSETASKLHRDMIFYSYGLALLANTDRLNMTDAELVTAFRMEFTALTHIYGAPPKNPYSGGNGKYEQDN